VPARSEEKILLLDISIQKERKGLPFMKDWCPLDQKTYYVMMRLIDG
jgi:hypothetical protein